MKNIMYAAIAFVTISVGVSAIRIGFATHSIASNYLSGSITVKLKNAPGSFGFRINCDGCY